MPLQSLLPMFDLRKALGIFCYPMKMTPKSMLHLVDSYLPNETAFLGDLIGIWLYVLSVLQ